jgi:nucleoside-diphosphate-sugar epimerase
MTDPKRVIILGASGFIAASLKKELQKQGIECRAISSSEVDLCHEGSVAALAKIITGDDALVVTSMLTPDKGRDAGPQVKNILMGKHVAEFLASNPCAHVIYLSSDAVYPESASLVTEETLCAPLTLYGIAHLMRERMILDSGQKKGIPTLILRPSAVYGAKDTHNGYGPNRFIRSALKENRIGLFGGGEEKRDHIYIDDVCRLLVLALQHRTTGILNAVTGHAVSFMEVAEAVKALRAPDLKIETSARANAVIHRHYDNTKLIKTFPLLRFTSLEKGLLEMLKVLDNAPSLRGTE